MYFVYVIYSRIYDKIYIGQTCDLENRIKDHNEGLSSYTKKYIPWEYVYTEKYETRTEAIIKERSLKTSRGRSFIWSEIKVYSNL